ncbi:uncharacterized protein LOC108605356, partial [Drosophila busckii]
LLLLLLLVVLLPHVRCQLQCNAVSRQKRISIASPAAGQLSSLDSCQYAVAAWSAQVCQVRIDFERLELPAPRLNASSQTLQCVDYLQLQRFQLCGRNNGQHLYVQLQQGEQLKLHFKLASHSAQSAWQLTLTQLECPAAPKQQTRRMLPPLLSSLLPRSIFGSQQLFPALRAPTLADLQLLAPLGCDQYLRSASGGIVSFNFAGGVYMPSMKYSICIAGNSNQEISYNIQHFALSKFDSNATGAGYDADCHSTVQTTGRAMDYLLIANSYLASNPAVQPTYYCGHGLAGQQLIARAPFIIHFSSDAQSSASETGFQLTYALRQAAATQSNLI